MNELQHNIKLGSGGISSLLDGFLEHENKQATTKIVEECLTSISTENLVAYFLQHVTPLHHCI